MKIISSYGIILLNYNKNKKNYEMLMIKKKHSYNYKDFVLGSYSNINKSYFNNMTLNEKEYIYSNNYDFMWYKLWSKFPNNDNKMRYNRNFKKLYLNGLNVFKKNFPGNSNNINNLNGNLLNLLNKSLNADLIWEFPKGLKKYNETNIDAAIREFKEETNINYDNYRLIWNIKPIIINLDSNKVNYKYYYYIAILENTNLKILPNFKIYTSINEISDMKWITLQNIKNINVHPKMKYRITFYMKKAISLYKHYKKNITI